MAAVLASVQGWTLDDIRWADFDASKAEPNLVRAIKAAALVEYNAPDYVTYLKRVFHDAGQDQHAVIEQWGLEEAQHGQALGRWAELADPSFNLEEAFVRFRAGYKPAHFGDGVGSVRGSKRAEMIARCVVESGTSSYYSAIRDATQEPVLRQIAGHIATDEYRHYKLFYDTLKMQTEPELPFWRRLLVAIGRINESDDDELAYAFYCANVPVSDEARIPYSREAFSRASTATSMAIYRRHHIDKLTQMVAKAVGATPRGRMSKTASGLLWRVLRARAGLNAVLKQQIAA